MRKRSRFKTGAHALACVGSLIVVAFTAPTASASRWLEPLGITTSPDGKYVYSAGSNATLVLQRDGASGALTLTQQVNLPGAAVAVSPDGASVYTATIQGDVIRTFSRDSSAGTLTLQGSVKNGEGGLSGFSAVHSVAVSGDGKNVYVTSRNGDAVAIFQRDTATGSLTLQAILRDGVGGVDGLNAASGILVSADGKFVYVAASHDSGIGVFDRNLSSGTLTFNQLVTGGNLGDAGSIAIAPDGQRVYAGQPNSSSYGVLSRNSTTGQLTYLGGLSQTPYSFTGWFGGKTIAVSPDSTAIFNTVGGDNAITQAARTAGGVAFTRSYKNYNDGIQGLDHPVELTFSPDGQFLYVVGGEDSDEGRKGIIAVFSRNATTNNLTFVSFIQPDLATSSPSSPAAGGEQSFFPPPASTMPKRNDGRVVGVTVNNGAIYVNDRTVELTIVPPDGASSLLLSNDGGFGSAETRSVSVDNKYPWNLQASGAERLPKTVYIRFRGPGVDETQTFSDDIILDETPPALLSVRLLGVGVQAAASRASRTRRYRLLLRASDNASGVVRMQIATNRRSAGKWRRFTKTMTLNSVSRRMSVRVQDGAGNRSRWRRIARVRKPSTASPQRDQRQQPTTNRRSR